MKKYRLVIGTFDDSTNEFIWHPVDEFDDLKKAYIEYKKYVNTQLKYTDKELMKVWKSGRLDIELLEGANKKLNWVGIYARAAVPLTEKEEKESELKQEKKKD